MATEALQLDRNSWIEVASSQLSEHVTHWALRPSGFHFSFGVTINFESFAPLARASQAHCQPNRIR